MSVIGTKFVLPRFVHLCVWFVCLRPPDRQITQEQVLDILPLVSEVNAISDELNKYQTFDVVLMTVAGHDGTTNKGTKYDRSDICCCR